MKRNSNCECLVCSKPIYRRPDPRRRGRYFCSQKCYGISCRRPIPCAVCGKEILRSKNAITCSRICSNINRKGTKYGTGSVRSKRAIQWRLKEDLMKLRGPKCESCGYSHVEILQVHHIIPKSKGGTNELDNIKLMCPNCHYLRHYGRIDQLVGQQP